MGGKGGTGGTGGSSCSGLEADYKTTLAAAKECSTLLPTLQCTVLVDDQLACPCSTYANPANTAEITKLQQLKTSWVTSGCNVGVICPAIACLVPSGASCTGSSGTKSGSCVDK
ncbi:MAG: hypothetical protein HS104_07360 [Polyangiaceae bacterium]|nr:hypothetical protein [Polyangiaceae bacterium]